MIELWVISPLLIPFSGNTRKHLKIRTKVKDGVVVTFFSCPTEIFSERVFSHSVDPHASRYFLRTGSSIITAVYWSLWHSRSLRCIQPCVQRAPIEYLTTTWEHITNVRSGPDVCPTQDQDVGKCLYPLYSAVVWGTEKSFETSPYQTQ